MRYGRRNLRSNKIRDSEWNLEGNFPVPSVGTVLITGELVDEALRSVFLGGICVGQAAAHELREFFPRRRGMAIKDVGSDQRPAAVLGQLNFGGGVHVGDDPLGGANRHGPGEGIESAKVVYGWNYIPLPLLRPTLPRDVAEAATIFAGRCGACFADGVPVSLLSDGSAFAVWARPRRGRPVPAAAPERRCDSAPGCGNAFPGEGEFHLSIPACPPVGSTGGAPPPGVTRIGVCRTATAPPWRPCSRSGRPVRMREEIRIPIPRPV